jgi:hypothetical protein
LLLLPERHITSEKGAAERGHERGGRRQPGNPQLDSIGLAF